jgi:hypothetical protein
MDDALVEACAYILQARSPTAIFVDARSDRVSLEELVSLSEGCWSLHSTSNFEEFPGCKILYDLPDEFVRLLATKHYFEPNFGTAREGMKTLTIRGFSAFGGKCAHMISDGKENGDAMLRVANTLSTQGIIRCYCYGARMEKSRGCEPAKKWVNCTSAAGIKFLGNPGSYVHAQKRCRF